MRKKMKHRALLIISLMFIIFLLSPLFIYMWGLSNIKGALIPTSITISEKQKTQIWEHAKEYGTTPKVKPITPYGYLAFFYCLTQNDIKSTNCAEKYPGLRITSFAIRNKVRKNLGENFSNLKWQITWISYSIWATRNWNIQQILSTYHEEYGNEYGA